MIELSGHEWHAEMQRRANDIIRVHNPSMEEYVVRYDTSNTNTLWVVPPANKDQFGAGRGNRDVPRYIATRFMEKMVDQKIDEEAQKEWEKIKKNYGSRDNIHREEERHFRGFRIDQKKRDAWRKKIWLGVVRRHGDTVQLEQPSASLVNKNDVESAIERLDLDKQFVEQNMQELAREVESAN